VAFADVGLNTATGGNNGVMHIEFSNGSHFECFYPPTEISGIIYGDRKFRCYNKGYILERKHKILTEYSIQNQKKGLY
jgi:transposase-like protein